MPPLTTIKSPETSILIVEDSKQYTMVLTKILSGIFHYIDITAVESSEEAYALLKKDPERFKLLFVDYNFPSGDNGGALLERLKYQKMLEGRIALLITSEPTVERLKEAVAAGALGIVAKPFDREELKNQLDRAERAIVAMNTESF